MSNPPDHDLHQDQLNADAGADRGRTKPRRPFEDRLRTPRLAPMRVRSSFGYRDSATAAAPCIERAHPWPPASLVARLNKGLWSLIGARFRVEH